VDISPIPFTSVVDFETWLSSQPANVAASAYKIALNIGDDDIVSLKTALNSAANKYVCLDLSGSTITSIVGSAFFRYIRLTGVTIGNKVINIGNSAFSECTKLANITIPDSVMNIGEYAFRLCTSLTAVIIPDSVICIGNSAFAECTKLASVTIGKKVNLIDTNAFMGCTSLTSVTIPSSVTIIWGQAFDDCTKLTSVIFEGTIPSNGFYSNSNGSVFPGDLRSKFYATDAANGTPGTYTRNGLNNTWTKQ